MGRIILQEECEGPLIWLSEALYVFLWNIFPACQTALEGNSMKPRWGIMDVSYIFLHDERSSLWLLHRLKSSDWKCWGGRTDVLRGLNGNLLKYLWKLFMLCLIIHRIGDRAEEFLKNCSLLKYIVLLDMDMTIFTKTKFNIWLWILHG